MNQPEPPGHSAVANEFRGVRNTRSEPTRITIRVLLGDPGQRETCGAKYSLRQCEVTFVPGGSIFILAVGFNCMIQKFFYIAFKALNLLLMRKPPPLFLQVSLNLTRCCYFGPAVSVRRGSGIDQTGPVGDTAPEVWRIQTSQLMQVEGDEVVTGRVVVSDEKSERMLTGCSPICF
ncbi:hypothetical protein J6590_024247 [Homalodisca vitripennis]|nr:hypothetical protein J6590_024247 [Homalodisca vitripennis]